jgi:signal transduction histidine kinase
MTHLHESPLVGVDAMNDKINILLVDDDPAKLLTYEAILDQLGEHLFKAHSGMEALEHLLKHDVALVLMDVCMPGMDGLETAQLIHQHPRFQNTPIIFVSGILVGDVDRLKGYDRGAVDYVPVPIAPEVLRAKVKVFADLHRKTRMLESLNARMTELQEQERRRIARELHDSVGQLLAAITMNNSVLESHCAKAGAEANERLKDNAALINEVTKQIRTISYLLHPPLLEEAGLRAALRMYVEGFSQRSNIKTRLDISPNLKRLPYELELGLFRFVQECLTNVCRHSQSPTAVIHVIQHETFVQIDVQDNGKGFSSDVGTAFQLGVGLSGMQERLRLLGGTLQVESNGAGTRVFATVPLPTLEPELQEIESPTASAANSGS